MLLHAGDQRRDEAKYDIWPRSSHGMTNSPFIIWRRPHATRRQFPSGFLVASLLLVSGLLWAVMFFGTLAYLSRLAGGLKPFDIRPTGYSYEEAWAFINAIGEQGRAYYLNPELIIDTVYPPLYAISRAFALWWLTMPGRVRRALLPLGLRYAFIGIPVAMASLDIIENSCIARMLWTWPDLSSGVVSISSVATETKIALGALTETLMGSLALIWLLRLTLGRRVNS
jgi:hypothetical protein